MEGSIKVKEEMTKRINKVISFIDNNLDKELNVNMMAEIACLSKYHFNRVFKSITTESVYQYIKRVRIERSFYYLWNSKDSVKEISLKCGFKSSSNFSHNFKKHFGISAKEQLNLNIQWKKDYKPGNIEVDIKEMPSMTLAYIKNIGSYNMDDLSIEESLYKWANARDLWRKSSRIIRINYDSMFVTKEKYYRVDICIEVPKGTKSSGNICIMEFPRGRIVSTIIRTVPDPILIRDTISDLDAWIVSSGYKNTDYSPNLIFHKKRNKKDIKELDLEIGFSIKPE